MSKVASKEDSCSERSGRYRKREHLWDPEMAGLIKWFESAQLPDKPYNLFPGLRMVNPSKFYMNLQRSFLERSTRPHSNERFLRATLRFLFAKFG